MGNNVSNNGSQHVSEKQVMNLKEKVKLLQEEIKEMMCEREKERRNYEKEIMVYAFKEADWKQERKKLKEELNQLTKIVEEKEEKIREMKDFGKTGQKNCSEREWESMGTKLLVEQMKEERARRDEAVERWKQLYLAIKSELDDLIQRTYDGDGVCWKTEQNEMQTDNLKKELQDKEEAIKALKAQLASILHEKQRKEREFDLLRQSLRIMNAKKDTTKGKNFKRFLFR